MTPTVAPAPAVRLAAPAVRPAAPAVRLAARRAVASPVGGGAIAGAGGSVGGAGSPPVAGTGGGSAGKGGATAGAGGAPVAGSGGGSAGKGGATAGAGGAPVAGSGGGSAGKGGATAGAGGAPVAGSGGSAAGAGGAPVAGSGGSAAGAGGGTAGAGGAVACNTLENTAPSHIEQIVMQAAPARSTFTGGQIATGIYFRTATNRYLPTVQPGPDSTIKETISITASGAAVTVQSVLSDSSADSGPGNQRSSYTAAVSDQDLTLTRTCPGSEQLAFYFSYANNTLTILDTESGRLSTYVHQAN